MGCNCCSPPPGPLLYFEAKLRTAYKEKCGYIQFTASSKPKYYLSFTEKDEQTGAENYTVITNGHVADPENEGELKSYTRTIIYIVARSGDCTVTSTIDKTSCAESSETTGTKTQTVTRHDATTADGPTSCPATGAEYIWTSTTTNNCATGGTTTVSSGEDCGAESGGCTLDFYANDPIISATSYVTVSGTTTGDNSTTHNEFGDPVTTVDCVATGSTTYTTTRTLSSEYTTDDLRGEAETILAGMEYDPGFTVPTSSRLLGEDEFAIYLSESEFTFKHGIPATCYLKVWFDRQFTDTDGIVTTEPADDLIPPYEWNEPLDDEGATKIIEVGPFTLEPPDANGSQIIKIRKFSYLRDYEPTDDNPSNGYPGMN